jgi:two-component system, OmpR family, sensor histidine kinase ChvG
MRFLARFFARISFRLMAFNLLLVFVPVAGVLYLTTYEEHMIEAQERAMVEQARLVSASLSTASELDWRRAEELFDRFERNGDLTGGSRFQTRMRLVDQEGQVLADTLRSESEPIAPEEDAETPDAASQAPPRSILYRLGAYAGRPLIRALAATTPLQSIEVYESGDRLLGPAVAAALQGYHATDQAFSQQPESTVTLYTAFPIIAGAEVAGAVLVSQSTQSLLHDLYAVRVGILRISTASFFAAVILSLLVATTIVRPLRQLRLDAGFVVDRRGRIRGGFRGVSKADEIGDVARALDRLTRRLEAHVQYIEAFAGDVSHEFKNPLASIRTATEMLSLARNDSERERFQSIIQQEVARMENLLSAVREISIIDAQLAGEDAPVVQLDQLIDAALEGFRLREGERIIFESEILGPAPAVRAHPDRLMQVLVNLLDNAVSFSPAGGTVRISVASGSEVVLQVSDEGPGIPEGNRDRIFDRFFTFRPGEKRSGGGHTGLGLAIVRAVVEGYGGSIRLLDDTAPGTVFEVRLPRVSQ